MRELLGRCLKFVAMHVALTAAVGFSCGLCLFASDMNAPSGAGAGLCLLAAALYAPVFLVFLFIEVEQFDLRFLIPGAILNAVVWWGAFESISRSTRSGRSTKLKSVAASDHEPGRRTDLRE